MKNLIKYSGLLQCYKNLFTKKQLSYLTLYFDNDYSFNEIAKKYNVSKSAIYDCINKAKKTLDNLEKKLELYNKKTKRIILYKEIENQELKRKLDELEQ